MTTTIRGEKYRISVLTSRMLRLEYQEKGQFEDRPTRMAICRDFPEVKCDVRREDGRLIVETDDLVLSYDEKPFSLVGLTCTVKATGRRWKYSTHSGSFDYNLKGTARTLDGTDGNVEMENGIFGRRGYAVIDDSATTVFEDGNFRFRKQVGEDLYFFGFGRDFYGGLKEFYKLSGEVPMLPRAALGNWWSRYHRYTEESYLELLDKLEEERIPIAVGVVDMDWHITEPDKRYGDGWTGYTWDEECFPDPARFLKKVRDRGPAVSLNLHPADGVRAFEAMYPQVAKRVGIDPATEQTAEHDFENDAFREAYFEEIMHPYEDMGVNFWWIDWQQGKGKGEDAVDPLLLLNYWHYKDQLDRGKRAMIFSRYAGPGSHRYPIGFSGDTCTTWKSLDMQPWFTSTASNIGYGYWSHDIGGHMMGDRDDERFIRWLQLGVFSPVMRIHCTNNDFIHREPWTFKEPYRKIYGEYMRLRHRLVPYLYTAVRSAHTDGVPLVCPMYYSCPDAEEAYEVPNAYTFGPSLIVSAITEPADAQLQRAGTSVYLPEGRWYDLFTGQIYNGGMERKLYRPLESIPVLLREGGILPMTGEEEMNVTVNPKALTLFVGTGKDGDYTLYEDDGDSLAFEDGAFAETLFTWRENAGEDGDAAAFTIGAAKGDLTLIPEYRSYTLVLCGLSAKPGKEIRVTLADQDGSGDELPLAWCLDEETGFISVDLDRVPAGEGVTVFVRNAAAAKNDAKKHTLKLIDEAFIQNDHKLFIAKDLEKAADAEEFLKILARRNVPELLKDAIRENFT